MTEIKRHQIISDELAEKILDMRFGDESDGEQFIESVIIDYAIAYIEADSKEPLERFANRVMKELSEFVFIFESSKKRFCEQVKSAVRQLQTI